MGAAIRFMTVAPMPPPHRIGNSPAITAVEVMSTGRTLSRPLADRLEGLGPVPEQTFALVAVERLVEVDEEHHGDLGRTPANAISPTHTATERL